MENNQYEHNSFLLYKDSRIFISKLNREQRGDLLEAIFNYACDLEIPDFHDDAMTQMCFEIIKSYLDRDEKKYQEKCRKRAEAGKRGGLAKASNAKQSKAKASNTNQSVANLADNDTDNDTVTGNVIDTENDIASDMDTETEQADADPVPADQLAASAAADAEPPAGDLFSVEQLLAKAKKNKVNLTEEGVRAFHEEMHESGWVLYQQPVEKRMIVRAMRGWAKNNPEYGIETDAQENNDMLPDECKEYFKEWLAYYGYDYSDKGNGNLNISISERVREAVFENYDMRESATDIGKRTIMSEDFSNKELEPFKALYKRWMKATRVKK